MKEQELYPPLLKWIKNSIPNNRDDVISAFDSSRIYLCDVIMNNSLQKYFKNYASFQIMPDLVCFIINRKTKKSSMCIIEVKKDSSTLGNACQLLGYSLICKPKWSFLISPKGPSDSLTRIINRTPKILNYVVSDQYGRPIKYDRQQKLSLALKKGTGLGGLHNAWAALQCG